MSQEFNKPLYEKLLEYATYNNSVESLTHSVVSSICNEMGTHIENEEVTLWQLYIHIARALVLPNLDFPRENRIKLENLRQSLATTDVVKLQKFHDLAFAPMYIDCIINALTKFNMSDDLYKELNSIQRNYGISIAKSKELENETASSVLCSVIDEILSEGIEKTSMHFVKTFVDSITFTLNDNAKKAYNNFIVRYNNRYAKK